MLQFGQCRVQDTLLADGLGLTLDQVDGLCQGNRGMANRSDVNFMRRQLELLGSEMLPARCSYAEGAQGTMPVYDVKIAITGVTVWLVSSH